MDHPDVDLPIAQPPDEAVLASIPSPAIEVLDTNAHRALATGVGIPELKAKDGVDPLLVRSLLVLERIIAGGLINPWSQEVQIECRKIIAAIREKVSEPCQEQRLKETVAN